MRFVFVSPHLDDVALSCGGIIHALREENHAVEIWTIFAGDPPAFSYSDFALSLHQRWQLELQNPVAIRRQEDLAASRILGAAPQHFPYADCIYRRNQNNYPLIQKEEDLFQPISGNQYSLLDEISKDLKNKLPQDSVIVSPLSIGNHIDHRIVHASLRFFEVSNLWFYADYPYVVKNGTELANFLSPDFTEQVFSLSPQAMQTWQNAVAEYSSQISTFWKGKEEMFNRIDEYALNGGGKILWKMGEQA